MLNNLISSVFSYWFNQDEPISWIAEDWTHWLWLGLLILGALLLLTIVVLFFKAIARTRERNVEKRIRKEVAAVEKRHKKDIATTVAATQTAEPQREVVYVEAPAEPAERTLTGLSVEMGIVQRFFTVGEEFNSDGLLVNAFYNTEPMVQPVLGHTVMDEAEYKKLPDVQKLIGAYVMRPNLKEAGIKPVVVRYGNRSTVYTISVKPHVKAEPVKVVEVPVVQPAPEPIVVEKIVEKVVEVPVEKVVETVIEKPQVVETVVINEESYDAGRLRYDKSFEAKFIQSDDEVKHWYTEIKNLLLSYKTCRSRISWKRETFKAQKEVVAKLVYRGNTLCVFLPLNPADFVDVKGVEDASKMPVYEDTPLMVRLKNEKRKRLALELIERVMTERGILHGSHQEEDFYLPYEGVVELINRGLIKREIKTVEDEAIFERDKTDEE